MSEQTNAQSTAPAPDPFDLATLRLNPALAETLGVKKVLTTIPVGKPHAQDFVRVHPDPEYRSTFAVVDWKEDSEFYVVAPSMAMQLPGECVSMTIYTCVNRQGVVRLWPVKLPGPDGRVLEWHRSAADAAGRAIDNWVRIKANKSLGAYEIFEAPATIAKPVWPTESFQQLIRIAFRDRIIDSFEHPIVTKLLGQS
jgi:hypothetical protein